MQRRRRHDRPVVQTKMVVGPAGDRYEREADRVARHVVSQLPSGVAAGAQVGRVELDDEELLQGKREPAVVLRAASAVGAIGPEGGDVPTDAATRINSARGGGRELDLGVRRSMERAFGADFSAVRVHDGPSARQLNTELGARAFTTGSDIFLSAGEYQPATRAGSELLAHELTHVVQQGAAPVTDPA